MTTLFDVAIHDIVRLSNGDKMVVTQVKPNRPANPFCGVLVNGLGAEYKFGGKHKPVVVGHADENHPALVANRLRLQVRAGNQPVDDKSRAVISHLLNAVEAGDLAKAQVLATAIRTMGF
jgi:hypothetical protein